MHDDDSAFPGIESPGCPADPILRVLVGTWSAPVLQALITHGPQRFGELMERVAGISGKVLTERLRALEQLGVISRHHETTIPPKATYAVTARGYELGDVLEKMAALGRKWLADGIAIPDEKRCSRSSDEL